MLSEKMKLVKVPGKNKKREVLMYAISTCVWCKLTKKFLKDNNIEYNYVDVDLCNEEDREKVRKDILNKGGSLSYPAIIIDNKILINGFRKDKISEVLRLDSP
jgi:glutaredoxin